MPIVHAEVSDETYLDVLAFARRHNCMKSIQSLAGSKPVKTRIPNVSEALRKIIEKGVKKDEN